MNNKTKNWIIGGTALVVAGGVLLGATSEQDIKPVKIKNDKVEIEIGDVVADEMMPEFEISKWDKEAKLKVYAKGKDAKEKKNPKVEDGKYKFEYADEDIVFYEIEDGFEFEIILKKKPSVNVWSFDIESENLDFLYQRELTQKDIDDGLRQPENVAGSYAVYHKTKRNHVLGQTNYGTGKFGHIYYPYLIDDDGWKVRAEDFKIENGIMRIVAPQDFLDNAVYPVVIDPIFGNNTIGGNSVTNSNHIWEYSDSPEFDGALESVTFYNVDEGANCDVAVAVYDTSDNLVAGSSLPTTNWVNATDWFTRSLESTPQISSAATYRIAVWYECSQQRISVDLSSAGFGRELERTYSGGSWPSSITWDPPKGWGFSIYATYTVTEAAKVPAIELPGGGNIDIKGNLELR